MASRARIYLAFSLFCLLPPLVISTLSFIGNLKFSQNLLTVDLQDELAKTYYGFETSLHDRQNELKNLAATGALRKYVGGPQSQVAQSGVGLNPIPNGQPFATSKVVDELRESIGSLLRHRGSYATVAAFSPDKHLMFVAEPPTPEGDGDIVFHTNDLLPDQIQPDEAVWTTSEDSPRCSIIPQASLGTTLRCTTPVFVWEEGPTARGALVADLKLDPLFSPAAKLTELPFFDPFNPAPSPAAIVTVLEGSGRIVYHTNDALKHQQVGHSIPYFAPIAGEMITGKTGTKFYTSSQRDEWLAAYKPVIPGKLYLSVARNYSLVTGATRRFGWLSILFALVFGTAATVFVSNYYLRRTQSIDRVAEGVGAIAKGELDHRIDLRSSDDLRSLADNVGLMTQQLREQIAREEESRHFQSFVRLSAILTHDLKNAIEALSLTVTNMERHFENAEFRADAMKTLRGATENLKGLVARLSNPVTTLSGEHKLPRPVDLVPMLKHVIAMTAEPARDTHDIAIKLPESLFALVDVERIEKVLENLIINALEAMAGKKGILRLEAGNTAEGKPFFSVSDTGEGMSRRFIEEKLFRPFATTKKRGVGLGLYTCREVVRAHGGSIEVDSQQGAGTTFRVVLPSAAIDKSGEIRPHKQPHS